MQLYIDDRTNVVMRNRTPEQNAYLAGQPTAVTVLSATLYLWQPQGFNLCE